MCTKQSYDDAPLNTFMQQASRELIQQVWQFSTC